MASVPGHVFITAVLGCCLLVPNAQAESKIAQMSDDAWRTRSAVRSQLLRQIPDEPVGLPTSKERQPPPTSWARLRQSVNKGWTSSRDFVRRRVDATRDAVGRTARRSSESTARPTR